MTDYRALIDALAAGDVRFLLVGGVAATAHGSSRLTLDVDVVYARDAENLRKLVACLAPHQPYLRGAPAGLPFRWDQRTLERGLNFTLTTRLGFLHLFGEITGGGSYEDLLPHTVEMQMFGHAIRCLDLPTLIRVKKASGRPKELETIAELEALQQEDGR